MQASLEETHVLRISPLRAEIFVFMKKIYIIGTLLLVTVGLIALRPEPAHVQVAAPAQQTPIAVVSTTTTKTIRANAASAVSATTPIVQKPTSHFDAPKEAAPTPNITILIGSTSYPVYAKPGSSVLGAMQEAASTSAFTFSGRDYPSLGFFIESIAGKKNADGLYWFLYINGKSSDTGASQTRVSAGDTIEWRYEKNY